MAKLTPLQVDQIECWAEKGKSGCWISRKLGIPAATVNYRMLRAGFDPWPGKRNSSHIQPGAFSPEEDDWIVELSAAGLSAYQIAKRINRAQTSVVIRLMTLEVRAEKALAA
jgi:DNA-binding CsgD family transcriptional regulator